MVANFDAPMHSVYRPIFTVTATKIAPTKVTRPIVRPLRVPTISSCVHVAVQMGHPNALPKANCAMENVIATMAPMRKRLVVSLHNFFRYLFRFYFLMTSCNLFDSRYFVSGTWMRT